MSLLPRGRLAPSVKDREDVHVVTHDDIDHALRELAQGGETNIRRVQDLERERRTFQDGESLIERALEALCSTGVVAVPGQNVREVVDCLWTEANHFEKSLARTSWSGTPVAPAFASAALRRISGMSVGPRTPGISAPARDSTSLAANSSRSSGGRARAASYSCFAADMPFRVARTPLPCAQKPLWWGRSDGGENGAWWPLFALASLFSRRFVIEAFA